MQPSNLVFKGYVGESIGPKGYINVNLDYKGIIKPIKMYVIPEGSACLLG